MKKKIFSIFMLLLVVSMGAWATEKELSPVGVLSWTNTPAITYDGEATSWAINQGGISGEKLGKYAGPYAIVKFDASSILDGKTLLSATLDFDITAGGYNSSINIAQMSDATFTPSTVTVDDFDATATQFQAGDWSTKNTTTHFSYDVATRVEANNVLAFAIYTNTAREQTLKNVKLILNYSDAPVAKYNYSLKAVTSEALDIKTLAEGEEFETNSATLYFPYMFYNESTLYSTATTPYSITVDKDNANKTVTYATVIDDIVAYMEGESADANSGLDATYSNGKTGHAAGNTTPTIATLPAGKYTATIYFVANGNRSCVIRDKANSDVATNVIVSLPIDKNSSAGIYTSDEFILTEETTIGFSGYTSDTKTNQSADIDYIFIEKTGDYVPVVATYAVNIAEGIVNGTVVAEPTSAKEGDEVTLTITPAEGYELASVSVTGVNKDVTVIVTDGKFTMPADDVTVNAEFQLPAPASYAVNIAEGIVNGTVVAEPTSAKEGDEVTLTITPAEGYELASVSVTGVNKDVTVIVTDGKFTMPADDVTVNATFQLPAPASYAVNIAEGIVNGTVVAEPTSAKAGDEVTLTITPAEGYEFASVSVTGVTSDESITVTDNKFTMPADDVTVNATFQRKPIYIETDLTAQFPIDYEGWVGATGYVGWAAPEVTTNDGRQTPACERYNGDCSLLGDVFTRTLTGLTNGTYRIELYGAAANTPGRGCDSGVEEGDLTSVYLYAETTAGQVKQYIPAHVATDFNGSGIATAVLENVVITDGTVKLGMFKDKAMTNWHVVQLKGVTAQVDAISLHANTLASAQAALAAEENAVITGTERANLETAIENNSVVAERTADAYKAAIDALSEATSAFTSSRDAYAAFASTKADYVGYAEKCAYASAEKISAVNTAIEAVPASADDAASKNAELLSALRVAAESNANAEGVEGAESITITNPAAEDGTNGWTVVLGEGSGGNISVLSNEPWTSADGSTSHKYFDGGDWGANAWDVALTQDVELAAGKYLLSAIGRASGDVALTLFAGENKAAMPSIGAAGGLFNRGWNYTSLEFEVDTKATVAIGVQGVTEVVHNWMSFSDFHLVLLEAIPEYAVTIAEGIEGGSVVAEPAYAKQGVEVTLTNTPAEGYEFVSYNVTTKTEDLAVIVTDGKFTMPDDDVTVNATFVKVSPIAYAVGMQNGTVTGPTSAKAGEKVTLTVTPEEGYELETLKITCEVSGNEINYDVEDYSFTMPEEGVYVIGTFRNKPIYIETDLTAQFPIDYEGWVGATGYVGWAAPEVTTNDGRQTPACERYNGDCSLLGDVFTRTLTGLTNGTYRIELYGAAANTPGRGCDSGVEEGDLTSVYLYAETPAGQVKQYIPAHVATDFNGSGIATAVLENVVITDGTVKLGMFKDKAMTNWHVVQLKGVTAQVDAISLHANTLASAQAALAAEENAVITGTERTNLETAIENNSVVAERTADAYKAAIDALSEATSAFTSAREAYAAFASTKADYVGYAEQCAYASAEKKSAVNTAIEATATSAAEATSKNAELISALRAMAESHVKAEGVEGAESVEITNPAAEDGTNGWTVVLGEGSGGNISVLSNEPWTSADGSTSHKYFDGGDWGANAWDVALTQDVELAAGKYLLSVIGRASGDVALTLFADDNKAVMPAVGSVGGLFNRGWNYTSLEFEVDTKATVAIGVQGVTEVVHNWMSFSDFHLVLLEAIPEYAVAYAVGMQNGTVSGPTVAKAGDKVTLTVTPEEGYELETLKITCEVSGNEINYDVEDYSFTMPEEGVYVIATFVQSTGIDAASAAKGKKIGVKKFFKNGKLIILDKDGNEFGANGAAK